MLLVCQNKTKVINFERLNYIQVSKVDEKRSSIEINISDCNWLVIADYKTEERAKEVLKEIVEQYEYCQRLQEGNAISLSSGNNYVYAMPKE